MMGKIALMFPGQGAQYVGMGQDVFNAHEGARKRFEEADGILGFKLSEIIFQGPEDQLKQTANTQPALLVTSVAMYEVFKEKGIEPDYVAGHSLGEYSALVAAGAISFADAVSTVRARGQFMEEAVPGGGGTMAAVLGAEREALGELCRSISASIGLVEPANLNCPGQIVVSGTQEGVAAVAEQAGAIGAKRVIPLAVSGPFHSSLMKPAAERLRGVLENVTLANPRCPVVANVTARPVSDPDEIRRLLVEQVASPVLWEDTVLWLVEQGVDTFIEIGPGNVLSGLVRKTNRSVRAVSLGSLEAIEQFAL